MVKIHGSILEYIKKGVVPKVVVFWGCLCVFVYIYIYYISIFFIPSFCST